MRAYTHAAHERLEHHPRMRAYARGELTSSDYSDILSALLTFWQRSEPQSRGLPEEYHRFLGEYRDALCADAAATTCREPTRLGFDEIAFFYLLLGSSHGARYMLRLPADDSLPRQHLRLLADRGKRLWGSFLHENLMHVDRARERQVMVSARQMFDCLHDTIDFNSE